jgi:hypothetical protein
VTVGCFAAQQMPPCQLGVVPVSQEFVGVRKLAFTSPGFVYQIVGMDYPRIVR